MADRLYKDLSADGILTLTMKNPGKLNAMTRDIRDALCVAFKEADTDTLVRAIILTGADGNFSAGGDLQAIMAVEPEEFRAYLGKGHDTVRAVWRCQKPTIAAIEGVAVGGGLALALCCDHIVISDAARAGFTFAKIGLLPDWGTFFSLPRRVGAAKAQNLFLTGRLLSGTEATQLGMADEICAPGDALTQANTVAAGLSKTAPVTYALTKRAIQMQGDRLDAVLEFELQAQQSRFKSDEFMKGVQRFL